MALDPWSYAAKTRNEYAEQVALFMWANMAASFSIKAANDVLSYTKPGYAMSICGPMDNLPVLRRMFAIKNAGHGDAIRGAQSKAEGVKAGVPDIMLPVVVRDYGIGARFYHGLFIELKRQKSGRGAAGSTSTIQDEWIGYLREAGYAVEVCVGWEAARDAIIKYLGV